MAKPTNWWKKYSFVIEIDGVISAAFTTCSGLRIVTETVKYREGGRLNEHKSPGLVDFPPITLTKGKSKDFDLYNWFKATFDAASGTGEVTPSLYRTMDLVQLDRAGNEVERHTIEDCYCAEYSAGDWDNNANEVVMEEVVIELDRWQREVA